MNRISIILGILSCTVAFADTTSLATVQVDAYRNLQNADRIKIDAKDWQGRSSNLAELLSELSGVSTQANGGWGAFQTISVQGMGGQRLQVYMDGFALNSTSAHTFDLASISLSDLSSVELIKNSTWESGSSSGGIVLLHRKYSKTFSSALQLGSQGYVKTDVNAGFGETWLWNGKFNFSRADNDFVYLDRQVAPYAPQLQYTHRMENAQFKDFGAELALRHPMDTKAIESSIQLENESQGLPGREGAWNPHAAWESLRLSARANYKGGNERFCESHGVRAFFRKDFLSWSADDPAFSGNSTSGGDYTQRTYNVEQRSLLSWQNPWLGTNSSWLLLYENLVPEPLSRQGFPSIPANRKQAQLNQEIYFKPKPNLKLSLLGQAQYWKDLAQNIATVSDQRIDWTGSVDWELLPRLHASTKYGTQSRIPGLSERFGSGVGTLGNPSLAPELGTSFQAAISYKKQGLDLGLGYFRRRLDSTIIPVYSTGMIKYLNKDTAVIWGLEPTLSWKSTHFKTLANATLQEPRSRSARKSENNKLLPGESKASANLSLSWLWNGFEVGARNKFWSELYRDLTNYQRVAPGQRTDLWLKYQFPSSWTLNFECTNVGNHYEEPIYTAIPAPGRRFSLSLNYQKE